MKIDLTKEEWEFLNDLLLLIAKATHNRPNLISEILEKLGSEWVDDE